MDDMSSSSKNEFFHIGLSLAPNSSHSSSVCVIDRNKNISMLDKLYFTDDIRLFFETSPFVKNSIIMVGLTPDESLLEGKWRIHSKNYKMLGENFPINKNNWTNRLDGRLKDLFLVLSETHRIYRCNINLLRQSYGLKADYPVNTSLDCKSFQLGLKIKYGFDSMPENLLSSTSLEAILCALFAYDINMQKINCKEIFEFHGIKVLNKS